MPIIRPHRFSRWLAAFTAAAMLCGSTAYLVHSDAERGLSHRAGHCDLCSHFSGATGPSAAIQLIGKPVLIVRQPVMPSQTVRSFRRNVDSRLPRGPPTFELT
jgi:hypothetical protein